MPEETKLADPSLLLGLPSYNKDTANGNGNDESLSNQIDASRAQEVLPMLSEGDLPESLKNQNGRAKNKEAVKATFLYWLALSEDERRRRNLPRTQGQFGIAYDVGVNTLSTWKGDPKFKAAYCTLIREKCRYELGEIGGALVRKAKSEDVPAMALYLKWMGELAPETLVQVNQSVTLKELVAQTADTWEPPTWAKGEAVDAEVVEGGSDGEKV